VNIETALDNLAIYFTSNKYQKEVLEAKAEYFSDVGIDDKENQRYEQWMNLFFEWFLFSRSVNLLTGKKVLVKGSVFAETLPKGAICDLRLVELDSKDLYCTKGFCAHPLDSEKFIKKQIKEYKKKSSKEIESLLLSLVRMFFKLEQYGHLESSQVYTFDSKVRF